MKLAIVHFTPFKRASNSGQAQAAVKGVQQDRSGTPSSKLNCGPIRYSEASIMMRLEKRGRQRRSALYPTSVDAEHKNQRDEYQIALWSVGYQKGESDSCPWR